MYDWNDLRHFLAVARGGSTLAAARQLGVNQTTSARRLQALEEALGQRLFDRVQGGRVLTEAGRNLVVAAEAVEAAARSFEDQVAALQRGLTGALRVTCSETMAKVAVTPALVQFNQLYPDIEVEVIIADKFLDLVAGEADIAVRATSTTQWEAGIVVRKLMDLSWALYCSPDYAERHGVPNGVDDLDGHILVGGTGELANVPWYKWLETHAFGAEVRSRSSTLTNLFHAVKSGLGVAPLPSYPSDFDDELVRCGPHVPGMEASVWLVAPERLRDHPRARAFMDFVSSFVAASRNRQRSV